MIPSDGFKLVIQSLSTLVAEKRQMLEALGMTNVAGDEAQRMRQSMRYSQVQADLWNAEGQLRAAIAAADRVPKGAL